MKQFVSFSGDCNVSVQGVHVYLKTMTDLFSDWQKIALQSAKITLSTQEDISAYSERFEGVLTRLFVCMREFEMNVSSFEGKNIENLENLDSSIVDGIENARRQRNEISLFFRGLHPDIQNKHYLRPNVSTRLLFWNLDLQIPEAVSQNLLLRRLLPSDKARIVTMLQTYTKNGTSFHVALSDILAGDLFREKWLVIQQEESKRYTDEIISIVSTTQKDSLTGACFDAYKQLCDMYGIGDGIGGIFSLNDTHARMFNTAKNHVLAVGLGVAGAALTVTAIGAPLGVPILGIAAGALAGGAVAAGTLVYSEGKMVSPKNFAFETVLNAGTFAVGGIVFRLVQGFESATRIGTTNANADLLGVENKKYAIEVTKLESFYTGEDLKYFQSIRDDMLWALIPISWNENEINPNSLEEKRYILATRVLAHLNESIARICLDDVTRAGKLLRIIDGDIRSLKDFSFLQKK